VSESTLPEMPCQELVEVITDYLEGRLSPTDQARFEAHIADCEYCETYLEQMRQTIRTFGRILAESLTDDARETLLEAFRSWRRP
jgi:anti-sigma factor RsiW